jgi:hypothetical protein
MTKSEVATRLLISLMTIQKNKEFILLTILCARVSFIQLFFNFSHSEIGVARSEMYRINKVYNRNLCDEAENQ